MTRVLFVCEGNIIRSQMAEAFYNHLTHSRDASSAGTAATGWDHPSPRVIEAMDQLHIDVRGQTSTQLTDDMIVSADRIILFPTHYTPESLPKLDKVEQWDIVDPGYAGADAEDLIYVIREEIRQRVTDLVKELYA